MAALAIKQNKPKKEEDLQNLAELIKLKDDKFKDIINFSTVLYVNEKLKHNTDMDFLLLTHESQEYITSVVEKAVEGSEKQENQQWKC